MGCEIKDEGELLPLLFGLVCLGSAQTTGNSCTGVGTQEGLSCIKYNLNLYTNVNVLHLPLRTIT